MTVGEILRQISTQFDNDTIQPNKWHTIKFSVRTDSDGQVWVENPQLKDGDHDVSQEDS